MEMRIKISKERFLSLRGYELCQELIQLPILQVRGQNLDKKRQVYEILTPGQKSLFSFWVLYGHTHSGWLQFYLEGLYSGGYAQFLPMIKAGLKRMNAQAMLENVMDAENLYMQYKHDLQIAWSTAELHKETVSVSPTIKQDFDNVDTRLVSVLGETVEIIEKYIRLTPEEFVVFTN